MRLKLSESPVFKALKAKGETARNPFVESFTYPGNIRRLIVAMLGIAAGLTVIWYTAMFSVLSFLQGTMRVAPTAAQLLTGVGAAAGLFWFVFFGRLSDRVGRSEEHTSELQSLMRISYAVFCLKKQKLTIE